MSYFIPFIRCQKASQEGILKQIADDFRNNPDLCRNTTDKCIEQVANGKNHVYPAVSDDFLLLEYMFRYSICYLIPV